MSKVRLCNNNGYVTLKFKFNDEPYAFNPIKGGKYNDKLSMSKARVIANQIEVDILTGKFTGSIDGYKDELITHSNHAIKKPNKNKVKNSAINTIDKPLDLIALLNGYLDSKIKKLKYNSLYLYRTLVKKLEECPHKRISEAREVIIWLQSHNDGNLGITLKKHYDTLYSASEWAIGMGWLESNPFAGLNKIIGKVKRKRRVDEINPFTADERDAIIEQFSLDETSYIYAALVEFMFFTGCRPCEARAISWSDVDLIKEVVTFSKSADTRGVITDGTKQGRSRKMPLHTGLVKLLAKIKPIDSTPNDLIFKSKEGGVINWNMFAFKHWSKILKSLPDIKYRKPYNIRHTAITMLVSTGKIDAVVIARWTGTSVKTIEQHYLGDVSGLPMPKF